MGLIASNICKASFVCVMQLYKKTGSDDYWVLALDLPDLDLGLEIGLWFDFVDGCRRLIDYSGVFSLPEEVTKFLRGLGIIVCDDYDV